MINWTFCIQLLFVAKKHSDPGVGAQHLRNTHLHSPPNHEKRSVDHVIMVKVRNKDFKIILRNMFQSWRVPGVLSPGVKRGRVVIMPTHSHLVQRSRTSGSYASLLCFPTVAFTRVTGTEKNVPVLDMFLRVGRRLVVCFMTFYKRMRGPQK
jgi:hypothetical protein